MKNNVPQHKHHPYPKLSKDPGELFGEQAIQDYPKDRLEIIIADAGSTDQTLDIISDFSVASNL